MNLDILNSNIIPEANLTFMVRSENWYVAPAKRV